MEVKFERHEPCPRCGSRDNLGVYSDGHRWCFGCGYYQGGERSYLSLRRRLATQAGEPAKVPPLPEDVSTYLPGVPYRWLKQWLTDAEILTHRIGWSNDRESVIFPIFDEDGNLLMWQARYFGPKHDVPKYLTKGLKGDILHILGGFPTGRIVLVEDLISAIVVSRVENSMPLWGSTIHLKTLRRLANNYGHLSIWLDADKLETAVKSSGEARLLFDSVEVIRTEEDPKYHNKEKVEEILGKPLDKRD